MRWNRLSTIGRRTAQIGWYIIVTAVCRADSTGRRYTERLAEAGFEPSVGSKGDSYDNALAESVIGLYKTEVIRSRGPWRGLEDVEFATLEWVAWFNHSRLLQPIGYVPPVEHEEAYYRRQQAPAELAALK
jgi:putative transposase